MGENKRYVYIEHKNADYILEDPNYELDFIEMLGNCLEPQEIVDKLNNLSDKNEHLKKSIKRQQLSNEECSKYIEEVAKENKQLKEQVEDLYECDKSLRKFASNMTLNYTGVCIPRRLFVEIITTLKDIEHNDLVEDLNKESIDTSANGC